MSWAPDDEDHEDDDGPYVRPRTIAGLLLVGATIALAGIDALTVDYTVDTLTLGILLGAGLLLLGVEAGRGLIR